MLFFPTPGDWLICSSFLYFFHFKDVYNLSELAFLFNLILWLFILVVACVHILLRFIA